jgi:hypothetical protein
MTDSTQTLPHRENLYAQLGLQWFSDPIRHVPGAVRMTNRFFCMLQIMDKDVFNNSAQM